MNDMHYKMRAKMKEFSALARSHVPECFALFAHPFVAVSGMQLALWGHRASINLKECVYVCVDLCVCVCAVHLAAGQTTSKNHMTM